MKPLPENTVVSAREILAYVDRDRYLDKREAAAYTSLSIRNLEARLDEIPHFRVGKKILFKKSELDRWMENIEKVVATTWIGLSMKHWNSSKNEGLQFFYGRCRI